MIRDLVLKNRSYRRFYQDVAVNRGILSELVDLGRLSASGMNRQPLKYILVHEPPRNALVFGCLAWASYLKDWGGPVEGERPSAYIVMLGDRTISQDVGCDHGIAAQSILLGAVEKGLGGCMIRNIRREQLRQSLSIPEHYDILLVIALGKPKEMVVIDPVGADGDIKYWRDERGTHHVPKRSLDDIIVG
ncbi:MAG: nitroreductase family protein [Chloroflexi bacterium]|nr:nitroreductase family protein [Chloroflexota bacterium]